MDNLHPVHMQSIFHQGVDKSSVGEVIIIPDDVLYKILSPPYMEPGFLIYCRAVNAQWRAISDYVMSVAKNKEEEEEIAQEKGPVTVASLQKMACEQMSSNVDQGKDANIDACLQMIDYICPREWDPKTDFYSHRPPKCSMDYFYFLTSRGCVSLIRRFIKHYPQYRGQTRAPIIAARYNKLDTLRFLCEEIRCHVDCTVIIAIAAVGNMEMLKYALSRCSWCVTPEAATVATMYGHFDVFKKLCFYLAKPPSGSRIHFAACGDIKELKRIYGHGYDFDESIWQAAALTGRLKVLKWYENKAWTTKNNAQGVHRYLEWHGDSIYERAALGGHVKIMDLLKTCTKSIPLAKIDILAALGGHLHVLQWISDNATGYVFSEEVSAIAARQDNYPILEWVVKGNCPLSPKVLREAAFVNNKDMIVWARRHGMPWSDEVTTCAAVGRHPDLFQWLVAQGCPANPKYNAASSKPAFFSTMIKEWGDILRSDRLRRWSSHRPKKITTRVQRTFRRHVSH